MHRDELNRYLGDLLEVARFRDYSPNGLQVEGRAEVRRIVTGVTASADLIDAAVADGADAILVHHGYFWRGEDPRLVGTRRSRIAKLIAADLNLFAFHLPLDAHPSLGNNAQLARVLDARHRLNTILSKHTGQTIDRIRQDTDRDNFMTGEQATAYGLIDAVLQQRGETGTATRV